VNPSGVTMLRDLSGLYGDAVIATLVSAVAVLFLLLVRAKNEHLEDVRAFGKAAAALSSAVEANTKTIQSAASTVEQASDTLRTAFELMGRRGQRKRESLPPTGGSG
jgi:hypothetical protein